MVGDLLFRQRKYTLALIYTIAGVVALFTDKISGQEFYLLALAVMGAYGWANVQEGKKP